jgi:hypothetical protein
LTTSKTSAVSFAVAIVAVGAVALSRLFDPFSGDQASFLVGAHELHGGAVLYRDYWDIKQPGIFYFFLAGGRLFGFTQLGEHAAEMLWQMIFSLTLVAGLGSSLGSWRAAAAFAPIAVIGAYYAGSTPWHLLQVEGLAGLPLFCCAWFAIEAARNPGVRYRVAFASGIAGGVAVCFKLLFALVAVTVVFAVVLATKPAASRRGALASATVWFAGLMLPLAGFIAYAWDEGIANEVVQTFVALPLSIARSASHAPAARLVDSALHFALYYRGIILPAIVGACSERHASTRPWRYASIAWVASGILTILIQSHSWWQYQFLLLVPPCGILATFGFVYLARHVARGGRPMVFALAAAGIVSYVAVPLPQGAIGTILRVLRERPYVSTASLERYRMATSAEYAGAARDAALPATQRETTGTVYVFGNPLIYVLAHRAQALGVSSWALQFDASSVRRRLDREFAAREPDEVFVQNAFRPGLARARGSSIASSIARDYTTMRITDDGMWYARRCDAPRTPRRNRYRC